MYGSSNGNEVGVLVRWLGPPMFMQNLPGLLILPGITYCCINGNIWDCLLFCKCLIKTFVLTSCHSTLQYLILESRTQFVNKTRATELSGRHVIIDTNGNEKDTEELPLAE